MVNILNTNLSFNTDLTLFKDKREVLAIPTGGAPSEDPTEDLRQRCWNQPALLQMSSSIHERNIESKINYRYAMRGTILLSQLRNKSLSN